MSAVLSAPTRRERPFGGISEFISEFISIRQGEGQETATYRYMHDFRVGSLATIQFSLRWCVRVFSVSCARRHDDHTHGRSRSRWSVCAVVLPPLRPRPRGGAWAVWARLSSSNKYGVRDAVRYGTADLRADAAFGRLAAAGRTVHVGVGCARWARASGSGHWAGQAPRTPRSPRRSTSKR